MLNDEIVIKRKIVLLVIIIFVTVFVLNGYSLYSDYKEHKEGPKCVLYEEITDSHNNTQTYCLAWECLGYRINIMEGYT